MFHVKHRQPRLRRSGSCKGKRAHGHKADAEAHRFALIRGGASPRRLHVYRCPYCRAWHVGHWPSR